MCIRDSCAVNAVELFVGLNVTFVFLVIFNLLIKLRRTIPCLLYTSDAADERSSVDLGGRRIIKKKNVVYGGGETTDELNMIHDERIGEASTT